jgi:AcrR family transcriptional regulator
MEQLHVVDTKRRLLDAAGEVFSAKGFKAATVREICRLAKANVAAVHYHFGDKEGLYKALLVEAFENGLKRYPPSMGLTPEDSPEARLFAFIHSFLLRMLGEGRCAWCGKLMAREMHEPTEALDHVLGRYILPLANRLRVIVAELIGGGAVAGDRRTMLCAMSIVGQCQYIFRSKSLVDKLLPDMRIDEDGIAELARHIATFSLNALKNMRQADETAVQTPSDS